jgi:hypothetical protein
VEHVDGTIGGVAASVARIVDGRPERILARLVPMEERSVAAAAIFLFSPERAWQHDGGNEQDGGHTTARQRRHGHHRYP